MKIFTPIMLVFLLLGIGACTNTDKEDQVPIESFFKKSAKGNFQLSPDGKYIAYLQPYKGVQNIYIASLAHNQPTRITTESDKNVTNFFWADNEELIFWKERSEEDNLGIYAVNRASFSVRNLIMPEPMRFRWVSQRLLNSNEMLIALNKRDSSVFDVYRLNIHDCNMQMVAQNPGNVSSWFADLEGKVRLAIASDGVNETLLYRENEHCAFKRVFENNFKNTVRPLRFIEGETDRIYALSNVNRDKLALVIVDLKKGEEIKTVYAHPEVDLDNIRFSTKAKGPAYVDYDTWRPERHYFNKRIEKIHQSIRKRLHNYWIRVVDKDDAETKFIVRTYTDDNPGAFYLYSLQEDQLAKLADVNPSLNDVKLSKVKPITYKARDGREINGYLTIPFNKKAKYLPLIVVPHNGPSSRNIWEYNSEVQFLASRGYAIFQPNYRGSTGYGKAFWSAGFGEWGGKIQEDIADGVKYLVDEGIADPKRVGLFGYSFGGFCALYGACFHNDLYRCTASYSGITNLFTYLKEVPPYYKPYLLMFYEMVGNPEKQADYFRAVSPAFHVDKIKGPIFIAQGGKDERGNVNETNQMVRELKSRQIPITYFLKEKEGHYFKDEQVRLEFYKQLESFFSTNLKNN
ncbi:S9 family peptidase [Olivibacter ginsenosidimutans]|uniref:S9 family peptidase n=1 Tax=Olivibacter ginsenosidimutans TaxID=1176537 RepID=A0ABP9ANJ3_9SPHI